MQTYQTTNHNSIGATPSRSEETLCSKKKFPIKITRGAEPINVDFDADSKSNIVMKTIQTPSFSGTVCISKKRLNRL